MQKQNTIINRVLSSIDWQKIKSYHAKIGIRWEYEVNKEYKSKVPSITELKSELSSIISHMLEEKLDYISHGSWIIFCDSEAGNIRVIFRLADFTFEYNSDASKSLEEALKKAVEKEDYESAAIIRDKINDKNVKNSKK